jgi:hypothetical protein
MIMLLFALLLSPAAPASAQSTLQLPDVTLFGEYTLFIAPPAPLAQEIPAATGMSDNRLSYPRSLYKVDLAVPDPPLFYWQRIPRSVLAPPGLLPDSAVSDASQYTGEGKTAASGGWRALVDYIPGSTIVSDFATIRSSGVWDLSVLLHFDLADGWITSPPESPTDLTFAVQSGRRAEALNIDAAFGVGAFYNADASAVYTLGLNAGLYGEAGVFQWREETRLFGITGIGGGSPPVDPDVQRGAVQQDLELALAGSRWDLWLRSGGVLAAGLPSSEAEEHGRVSLELGWHLPSSVLRLWAGGAALYYEDSLAFYPSGGLELYPSAFFSLLIRAAPFVRLPTQRLQTLCTVQAVSEGSGIPHLQSEGGYSLYSELRFDPGAVFGAAVSFEWTKGRIYLLDASDRDWGVSGEMSFTDISRGALQGDLIWQLRSGQPGLRLNFTASAAAAFPLAAGSWQELLYSHAGVIWTTDFHKLPVEFIIKGLIGDFADDGSREFLFTDWEIRSGIVTSIEGNWKIGTNGAVHTGFEAFLSPNFSFRFLIGYGIRR